ncbi:MAG TPA: hypothetical protein VI339_06715 [Steroidobacteraceae bacterium]|nr:hypothetical protein [Steroidobacteraceae bacterium]
MATDEPAAAACAGSAESGANPAAGETASGGGAPGGGEGQAGGAANPAGGGAGQPGNSANTTGGPGQGPAVPAGGSGNRREEINRRLDETFGVFDEAVRGAQDAIAKDRAAQQGQGNGEPGGDAQESGGADDAAEGHRPGGLESVDRKGAGSGEGSGAGTGSEEGAPSESTQGGVGGGAGAGGGGPSKIPADIPDGRDDDIVARQIREAAIKETDPELRAALWEEYRRYKKGS